MTDKEAYLILNLLPYIGPIVSKRLLNIVDSCYKIFYLSKNELINCSFLTAKQLNSLLNWQKLIDLEKEKRMLEKSQVHLITYEDEHYPQDLKNIYDPPMCLYAQGDITLLKSSHSNFAVVGSRRNTQYGCHITEKLVSSAVNCQWTIVSGLALGIDTIAHKEALKAPNGRTIAVLGSGLGCVYPQENIFLIKEIISKKGVVISEFPLLKKPDKTTFPMRNRLIAGLSMGVLVIEGGINSGSLITANMAAEQGKLVFAVPGNIDRPSSQGCHRLIKSGAVIVTCFEDIIGEYSDESYSSINIENYEKIEKKVQYNLQLSDLEESIIKFIALEDIVSFDDILIETDEIASVMFTVLIKLETKKMIKALPGRMYSLSDYIKGKL